MIVTDFLHCYSTLEIATINRGGSPFRAPTCDVAYRKNAVTEAGIFDQNLDRCEDYDLMTRVCSELGCLRQSSRPHPTPFFQSLTQQTTEAGWRCLGS